MIKGLIITQIPRSQHQQIFWEESYRTKIINSQQWLFFAGFNDEFLKKRKKKQHVLHTNEKWLTQSCPIQTLPQLLLVYKSKHHPVPPFSSYDLCSQNSDTNFINKAWQKIIPGHDKIFKWSWIIWKMKYINQVWEPHPKAHRFGSYLVL